MPPFSARSVPVLMKLPSPSVGSSVSVPPLTLAVMRPAFLIVVWLRPMLPWPWMVLPAVLTSVALPVSENSRELPATSLVVPLLASVSVVLAPAMRRSASVPMVSVLSLTVPAAYTVWLSPTATLPVSEMGPCVLPSMKELL